MFILSFLNKPRRYDATDGFVSMLIGVDKAKKLFASTPVCFEAEIVIGSENICPNARFYFCHRLSAFKAGAKMPPTAFVLRASAFIIPFSSSNVHPMRFLSSPSQNVFLKKDFYSPSFEHARRPSVSLSTLFPKTPHRNPSCAKALVFSFQRSLFPRQKPLFCSFLPPFVAARLSAHSRAAFFTRIRPPFVGTPFQRSRALSLLCGENPSLRGTSPQPCPFPKEKGAPPKRSFPCFIHQS